MSAFPRISVIVATHNRPHYLVEALDSLVGQHLPPQEVLVVDDGSGPATRRALEDWMARQARGSPRLRYFRQANSGPAIARNRGAAAAEGEYLLFMDDDDLMAPDALRLMAAALQARHDAAVSMASHVLLHPREGRFVVGDVLVAPGPAMATLRLADMIAGRWFVPVHGYLFTRAAVARMGPWDPSLSSQEDDEWLLRAALRGVEFVAAPSAVVHYRQHDGVRRATPGKPGETVLEGRRKRLRDDLVIRERVARELRAGHALESSRAAFLQWWRRLRERYGDLLPELDRDEWSVLQWLRQRPRESRYGLLSPPSSMAPVPRRQAR